MSDMNNVPAGIVEDRIKVVVSFLQETQMGHTCSYQEILSRINKTSFDQQARGIINAARNRLLKESNILFDTVRNYGLTRLSDDDIVKLGPMGIRKIRRAAERMTQKMIAADYEKLSNENKVTHNTYLSVLGAVSSMSQPSRIAQVKKEVAVINSQLSIGSTLEALK